MCEFVTKNMFLFSGLPQKYTEDEIDRIAGVEDLVREEQFIDVVYGDNSRLESEVWIKNIEKKASWVV